MLVAKNYCGSGGCCQARVSFVVGKMVVSYHKKQRMLYLCLQGYKATTIARLLEKEGTISSRRGTVKLLKCYKEWAPLPEELEAVGHRR